MTSSTDSTDKEDTPMKRPEWLTLTFTLPTELVSTKVEVWRKLMQSGALSLNPSIWILPASPRHLEFFNEIAVAILQKRGQTHIQKDKLLIGQGAAEIIQAFNDERNEEYASLLYQCEAFYCLMDREVRKGSATHSFAELEENELEYDKLRDRYGIIRARDFFGADLKGETWKFLSRCKRILNDYRCVIYIQNDVIALTEMNTPQVLSIS
jgi:hypothetical protein